MKLKWKVIVIILTIVLAIVGCNYIPSIQPSINNQNIENDNIEVVQYEESIGENNIQEEIITPVTEEQKIELVKMYTTTGVNLRKSAGLDGEIVKVLPINTEIQTVPTENEWTEVRENDNIYYISTKYISKEKTKIPEPKVTSRGADSSTRVNATKKNSGNVLTKSKGVNYFNGHKETWYSQKVLPGGGLKIPGRHVAADGTVRDKDNYICVASSDYKKGTIVETSLGTGKVYDCGCASGTIDIYTNW